MCHQVAKHFLCVCPDRNDPQRCPHAECLRIRAEAAVDDGGFVGTGWYTRSSPRGGQRHRVWEPYATVWEHCVAYRLRHTDKKTGRLQGGFEELCEYGSKPAGKSTTTFTTTLGGGREEGEGEEDKEEGQGKVEIKWEMGLCQDCFEGHRSMQARVEGGKGGKKEC
jgi:hypothetical protein